jgi:hypothetical protein
VSAPSIWNGASPALISRSEVTAMRRKTSRLEYGSAVMCEYSSPVLRRFWYSLFVGAPLITTMGTCSPAAPATAFSRLKAPTPYVTATAPIPLIRA